MADDDKKILQLGKVPQILSMLVDRGGKALSKEAIAEINQLAKDRKIFAAQAAMEWGVSGDDVQRALFEQAQLKIKAASADLNTIAEFGTQEKPGFLKANWGNNGVNKAIKDPTIVDGAISVANIAQNMVITVNDHPEMLKDPKSAAKIKAGMEAAEILTATMSDPAKAKDLTLKQRDALIAQMTEGLEETIAKSGETPKDAKGNEIDLKEYIKHRTAEIKDSHDTHVMKELGKKMGAAGVVPASQHAKTMHSIPHRHSNIGHTPA